ncbi:ferredoxin family protein [Chlorobium sp. BLA1]|uniref:4Fe-4S dicluster domain-containing protein n=1 Tax=Candidatus Chlorobium masyuteum TaxID=2716876 RepID=UPI0014211726|nr:ferredoxin family protein [Candidatus Chlorobium masyuteum]NHQ59829.1 ferredoxin family protein [Candidatus Chlorobium masyuteum]
MRVLDCLSGSCTRPSCDGCIFRPVRSLRLALKSRAIKKSDETADAPVGSWERSELVTPTVRPTPEKHTAPKKRKRLLAPREEIAWFPIIKPELCNGCGDCKVLCKPGVFELGEPDPAGIHRPKLIVAHPYNCLVLCNRCVPICTSGAIILPPKEEFEQFVEYID